MRRALFSVLPVLPVSALLFFALLQAAACDARVDAAPVAAADGAPPSDASGDGAAPDAFAPPVDGAHDAGPGVRVGRGGKVLRAADRIAWEHFVDADAQASSAVLLTRSLASGEERAIYSAPGGIRDFVLAGQTLFIHTGALEALPLAGGTPTPLTLPSFAHAGAISLTADANALYVSNGFDVAPACCSGTDLVRFLGPSGPAESLGTVLVTWTAVAVDADAFYGVVGTPFGAGIDRLAKANLGDAGALESLATVQGVASELTVTPSFVFWLESGLGLRRLDKTTKQVDTVSTLPNLGQLVASGDVLYFAYAGVTDPLTRQIIPGTGAISTTRDGVVASGLDRPYGVAPDPDHLYWTSLGDGDLHDTPRAHSDD